MTQFERNEKRLEEELKFTKDDFKAKLTEYIQEVEEFKQKSDEY